jgi:hypothetical protein
MAVYKITVHARLDKTERTFVHAALKNLGGFPSFQQNSFSSETTNFVLEMYGSSSQVSPLTIRDAVKGAMRQEGVQVEVT